MKSESAQRAMNNVMLLDSWLAIYEAVDSDDRNRINLAFQEHIDLVGEDRREWVRARIKAYRLMRGKQRAEVKRRIEKSFFLAA